MAKPAKASRILRKRQLRNVTIGVMCFTGILSESGTFIYSEEPEFLPEGDFTCQRLHPKGQTRIMGTPSRFFIPGLVEIQDAIEKHRSPYGWDVVRQYEVDELAETRKR